MKFKVNVVKQITFLLMTMALAVVLMACPAATPKKTEVTAKGAIGHMAFVVGDAPRTVTLTGFFDATNPKYSATSGNPSVATVSLSGAVLTVTPVGPGIANVSVTAEATADDEEGQAQQVFSVAVSPPPTPPPASVTNEIADMEFAEGDSAMEITLTGSFNVINPVYTADSSNASVAGVSVDGAVLTVTPGTAGTANVTVTATGDNGSASQTFSVTVTAAALPDNNAPRLRAGKELPHHTDLMFGGSRDVDLSEYFTDDDGDPITYDAESTDEAVVTVSVSGSMLTITVVNHGDATVRVTATDDQNLSRREVFDVTVINQAPVKTDENTHFGPYSIGHTQDFDLSDFFTDVEGDPLTYTAESSDVMIATVTDPDTGSMITIEAVGAGTAMITVVANDGANDSDPNVLTVTVSAVPNVAPVVSMEIPDQTLQLVVDDATMTESASAMVDLSDHFSDEDNGPDPLSYSSESEFATFEDTILTIRADAYDAGVMTTITVTASDGADEVSDTFDMMVASPERPARTSQGLNLQTFASPSADPMEINLGSHFSGVVEYDASSDNPAAVTTDVDGEVLTLTPIAAGDAVVTVTASNSGGDTSLTFRVKVEPEAMPPAPAAPTNPTPIPPQKVVLGEPKTVDISGYFTGATSYTASGVAATVMAAVTDAGMLTLTPVAHGTAEVRVTAINSAGQVSDDFAVTVQAKPMFDMDKSLPDLRIQVRGDGGTPDGKRNLDDLSTLFEDPDDPSAALKFTTTTSDATKVQVVKKTTNADGDDTTALPTGDPAADKAREAEGKDVVLWARAVGSVTITVKVTDSDELSIMETFVVTVTAAENNAPADVPAAAPDGLITSFTGATRLKLSDAPKKAIDNKAINEYFSDDDLSGTPGDMLTFTVEFSSGADPTPADVDGLQKVTVPDGEKIAVADQIATVEVSPTMWDGDPHGGEDKFTVTVTPKKAGVAQRILIIATDLTGEQDFRSFEVQVNNAPKPEGAQEKPLMLSSFKGAEGLKSTQPDGTTANTVNVPIVAPNGGYFSDADMTDSTATSDSLTCSFRPSVTGDTAPVTLAWDSGTGNDADNNTESITLVVTTKTTYSAGFVPMTVAVSCSDGLEETTEQTFTVSVTAQASIH